MQRLEVSGAVRPIYGSLGIKRLRGKVWRSEFNCISYFVQPFSALLGAVY